MASSLSGENSADDRPTLSSYDDVTKLRDFYTMKPNPTERPSEFVIRLEIQLQKVLATGIVRKDNADDRRLEYFRATFKNSAIITLLHARFPRGSSPSFIELFKAVKFAEGDYSRCGIEIHHTSSPENAQTDNISELRQEIDSLKEQVKVLQAQMKSLTMSNNHGKSSSNSNQRNGLPPSAPKPKVKVNIFRFCYNCGDYFHNRWTCSNPTNDPLVCERLRLRYEMSSKRKKDLK